MTSRELTVEITEKEAPYAPSEQLGEYTVRRWTFREKQESIGRASKILDEVKGLVEMSLVDFQMEQIMVCVKPPEGLKLTRETVGSIDPDVGDLLLDACRKVNGTTVSARASFLEHSEEAEATTG